MKKLYLVTVTYSSSHMMNKNWKFHVIAETETEASLKAMGTYNSYNYYSGAKVTCVELLSEEYEYSITKTVLIS